MIMEINIMQPVSKDLSLAVEIYKEKTLYVKGYYSEGEKLRVELIEEREESYLCEEVTKEKVTSNNPYAQSD